MGQREDAPVPANIGNRLEEPHHERSERPDEPYLTDPDFRTDRQDDFDAITETLIDQKINEKTGELRHEWVLREGLDKRDASPTLAHLSDEATYAVHSYTRHDIFHNLNSALRTGSAQLRDLHHQARAIVSGLNELPPYRGEVARNIYHVRNFEAATRTANHYRPGEIIVETQFVSSSRVSTEHPNSAFPGEVELRIQSKTGRDISELAAKSSEREVLFKPGTQLLVHSRELVDIKGGDKKWIIHAEEISPDDERYLDPDTARKKIDERRAAAAREEALNALPTKHMGEVLGTHLPGEKNEPKASTPSITSNNSAASAAARAAMHEPAGGWSALNRATHPPAEPAIHAATAQTPQQQVRFLRSELPEISGVNTQNFYAPGADEAGYRTNCTRAVVAFEHRMHGLHESALPLHPDLVDDHGTLSYVQETLGGNWDDHADFDSIIRTVSGRPVGSRAVLAFQYFADPTDHETSSPADSSPKKLGHMVSVVNTQHGIAFVDPQSGRLAHLPNSPVSVKLLEFDNTVQPARAQVV